MKIQVLGGGAWGMALARLLAGYGHTTHIWVYDKEELDLLCQTRGNEALLPGVKLHESTVVSGHLCRAVSCHARNSSTHLLC